MKKKFIFDTILNLVSSLLPLMMLQFLILPQVAQDMDSYSYGQLISIIAFINLSASSFGGALNNSRLISFNTQDEEGSRRNFNLMLLIFSCINTLLVSAGLIYYGDGLSLPFLILIIIMSLLMLYKTYNTVEFRIKLDFINILMSNVFLFIGYLIGLIFFLNDHGWVYIYLLGFLLSSIYVYIKIPKTPNPLKPNNSFRLTFNKTCVLLGSGLLASTIAYIDKLLIFPILGGYAVTIFYTSTLLGKTLLSVMGPVTSVILSYLVHLKKFSNKYFFILVSISSIFSILGYFIIVFVSEPLLELLYPQYVEESMRYIPVTTLGIVITVLGNIVNSVVLKFRKINWQIYINLLHLVSYLFFSLLFLMLDGLYGFCVGIVVATSIRFIVLIIVFYKTN